MSSNRASLANCESSPLLPEQIDRFTLESLQAKPVRNFDLQATMSQLRTEGSKTVIAIDIGGDKLIAFAYEVHDSRCAQSAELLVRRGDNGSSYLESLVELARLAWHEGLAVGISFAGPTDGTRLLAGPNVPTFMAEFSDRYGCDFASLFPAAAVANDAEAGIMAAALEAAKRYPETQHVIYVINGSGLGGAILTDSTIFAAEPGHVEADAKLNRVSQQKSCGMLGASYVCLEAVAASKAGIEDIWLKRTGSRLSGKEIAARYLSGDRFALGLYDNSAMVTAHVIKGMAKAFRLPENLDETVVVGHGGIFAVPGYGERVHNILETDLSCTPRMLFTKDFSTNTCLDGAAIAGAISRGQ